MSSKSFKFGDYVTIEMKRHGVENERYTHKVIGQSKSNTYVDVPVQSPEKEVIHDKVVPVVSCICCGVDETKVLRFRVEDVVLSKQLFELEKHNPEPAGYINPTHLRRNKEHKGIWSLTLWNKEGCNGITMPLYTSPQRLKPLSDDEILSIYADCRDTMVSIDVARAIEKAYGIGE